MDENPPVNHGSDRFDYVEATWRTKEPSPEQVKEALKIQCPDCRVNVFIREDDEIDGSYHVTVAHDETCPWLAKREADAGA